MHINDVIYNISNKIIHHWFVWLRHDSHHHHLLPEYIITVVNILRQSVKQYTTNETIGPVVP